MQRHGYCTLGEAFTRLDFLSAVQDVRRFSYVVRVSANPEAPRALPRAPRGPGPLPCGLPYEDSLQGAFWGNNVPVLCPVTPLSSIRGVVWGDVIGFDSFSDITQLRIGVIGCWREHSAPSLPCQRAWWGSHAFPLPPLAPPNPHGSCGLGLAPPGASHGGPSAQGLFSVTNF